MTIIRSPVRSLVRSPVRSLFGSDNAFSWADRAGVDALHAWDFTTNKARFNSAYVGSVTNTPNWTYTRADAQSAYAETAAGVLTPFATGVLRRTDKGVLIEATRTNLFLNSAVGATQSVTVTAAAHTLSFRGTGTITLTGASTSGPLVGTGANNRVTLTFTPSAGSLTLTVSGSCTNVNLEAGAFASSWIETTGSSAVRAGDVLTISSPGVTYPLTLFAEFERVVDTASSEIILEIDAGSNAERAVLFIDSSDRGGGFVTTVSVNVASMVVTGALAMATPYRTAIRAAVNNVQAARGGTLATVDTSAAAPATPTHIRFGLSGSGANCPYAYIRRAAIFNSALTDAQLQTVTA